MRYESMMSDQQGTLLALSNMLNINGDGNLQEIIAAIDALKYENTGNKNPLYHMENLLHKGHITDGRHGSWKAILDNSLLEQIQTKYREWFIQNNYPL
jgi:hypothetical protein